MGWGGKGIYIYIILVYDSSSIVSVLCVSFFGYGVACFLFVLGASPTNHHMHSSFSPFEQ